MAKKEKEQSEEPKQGDLQVPEKPKKRGGGDLKIVPLVGIIGGTVLFMILVVFSLYWFFIRPDIIASRGGNDSTKVHQEAKELTPEEEEKAKLKQEMAKLEEADALGETEGVLFVQTPDIIANTNPPNYYVVIQLGLEYRLPATEAKAEGGGHGGGAAGPTLPPKLMSEVSSFVTRYVGSKSLEQISALRDSLDIKFHAELKPIFIKNKIFLRKVSIPKFIMQSA